MKIFLFAVVFFLSWIVGIFGFCQIVGTLKFLKKFSLGSALITIVLWVVILGFGAFAVIKWLNDQAIAMYIGYGIALIQSFKTQPD